MALEHSYVLDWEREKAPLVPPNGMVRALGALPDLRRASIGGGISSTSRAGTVLGPLPRRSFLPARNQAAPKAAGGLVVVLLGSVTLARAGRAEAGFAKGLYLAPRLWVPESANAQTDDATDARRN